MGFLSDTLRALQVAGQPLTAKVVAEWLSGGAPSATGLTVSPESALGVTAVWDCVDLISSDVARTPLHLYRRMPDGGREPVFGPLQTLLEERPNPYMTAFDFRKAIEAQKLLRGNAFAEIERDRNGAIIALWPLRSDRMQRPQESQAGTLLYTYTLPDGKAATLRQDQVLHLRGFTDDGIWGKSPVQVHRETIGVAMAQKEYTARFYGNNARPGGYLSVDKRLTDEAARKLKSSWNEMHQGLSNAHRVGVLEEGVKWNAIGMTNEDAEFLNTAKYTRIEIASIYHVPPHKIGEMDRATFCLPADAEVYTETGPKSIRDVRPGELIWSRGEDGPTLAPVRAIAVSGYQPVITLRTQNRTLRLTANHRVLVRRQHVHAGMQKRGGCPIGAERVYWASEWVEAGKLERGDTLVTLRQLPMGGSKSAPTRPNVSIGFMEFCGLLLGDGNLTTAGVTIARAKTANYMDYYREVMRQEFHRYKNGGGSKSQARQQRPIFLQEGDRYTRFSSVSASRELALLGLSGNARTKRVPDWVFRLDAERRLAFLRGYLDADGSVDKKGRIAYHSVGRTMLSQIRHLCIGLGIPVTNLRRQAVNTVLPDGEPFSGEVFTFTCSDPGANRRIWSHDARYQERLTDGRPFGRKGSAHPWHGGRGFDEPGFSLSRLVSVESGVLAEPVYDLQVDGTASFVANGVVVHNSNISEQSEAYVADTLDTEYAAWEQTCNMALLSPMQVQTFYIEFIRNALVRTTIDRRYEAYDRAWWMTPNEIRALENMNALPGMDEIVLPVNRIPLSLMEAQALKPAPVRELQRVGSGYRVIEAPHE